MGCEVIPGVGFACSRGQKRKTCSVHGCSGSATKLCDFPLTGKKAGQTCDRDLCEAHATRMPGRPLAGQTIDYCPTHATVRK